MIANNSEARENDAYEFERFERRPRTSTPNLTVVRTDREKRIASDRQRVALLRTVSMLMVVAILAAVYLYSKVQVNELTRQISAASDQLENAQSEKVRLTLLMEGQMSTSNIETYAEELGLAKLQQYQVTCISLNDEDVVTIQNTNDGFYSQVWEGISGFFAGVGAYFGL